MMVVLQVCAALVCDWLFGDPRWLPHPVRGIGWLCEKTEAKARSLVVSEKVAGALAFFAVLGLTLGLTLGLLRAAAAMHPYLGLIMSVVLLYTAIAARDLFDHSMRVHRELAAPVNIASARRELGKIVGRDTEPLDESGVAGAAVESVAENMVDGITAPLFWSVVFAMIAETVGGEHAAAAVCGAFFYKAINTMDSMFGYTNERYLLFGRTAARADDLANFFPARLSGLCVVLAAWAVGGDSRRSWQTFIADRLRHASPNSGHSEAAVAGALGVRLGGPTSYWGEIVEKPYLNSDGAAPSVATIIAANRLVIASSLLFTVLLLGFYGVVTWLLC